MTVQGALVGKKNENKAVSKERVSYQNFDYLKKCLLIIPTGSKIIAYYVLNLTKTVF